MRLLRALVLLATVLAPAACGGDSSGPDAFPVRNVVIRRPDGTAADTMERLRAFGPVAYRLQAFDAAGVQLTADRYVERWRSSNVDVASVSPTGVATAVGNGRTVLVATADGVADSVALVVAQEAVAARAEQDGPAQFTVVRVDANGEEAPSPEPLVVTNLDPARIDVVHLPGDTVRVTGLAPGDARITIAFGSFSTAMRVQVVSAYAVITVNASQDGIILSPSSVTIPVGAAVLFRNGETASVGATGSGWRVGPVAGGTYEGQLFTVPGTYTFTSGSANGTVVVSP
jgi:hypothetical protein